jgi:DNA-binding beta-propeller fold protein YncE
VTFSRAWLTGVLKSRRGRAACATAIGAVALASAMPAAAAGATAAAPAPRVIATTAIGQYPAGLAVNPRTGTVYVLNNYSSGSDRVAVLNPRTSKIATTIPIKGNVRNPAPALAVSPVTGDIYVNGAHTYSRSQSWVDGAVTAISGRTNKVIATIGFHAPRGGAVSPVTGDFYVANTQMNGRTSVVVINGDKVLATIGVPKAASVMAISPLTGAIYVAGGLSPTVTVISGRTNKIIATIDFPQNSTMSMAVSPVTGKVYAEDGGCTRESECTSTVAVISGQTNKIIGRDSFDSIPGQIAFGSKTGDVYVSTGDVYVTGANSQELAVISGQTNKVIDSIEFPACEPSGVGGLGSPGQFAISPRTGNLFVPIASGNDCRTYSVQVVSSQTNKIIGAVQLPTPGQQIAADPVTGEIYVLRPQTLTSVDGEVPPSVASVISD